MDNRSRGSKFGERRSFGDRKPFGRSSGRSGGFGNSRRFGGDREQNREMHDIICKKCGKNSQVPFKPKDDKSVLCRDCFRQEDSSFSPRGRDNFGNQPSMSNEQLKEINSKLDSILKILEDSNKHTGGKTNER